MHALLSVLIAASAHARLEERPEFVCRMHDVWLAARSGEPEQDPAGTCPPEGPCDDPSVRAEYRLRPRVPGKVVQVRVLVLREDDGSNPAATQQDVDRQMEQLNRNFAPYRLRFEYTTEFIDDSRFRVTGNSAADAQMKQAYAQDTLHRCHLWVTGSGASYGTFPWMPAALLPGGGIIVDEIPFSRTEDVLTHEFGHNLGLWHTFHGVDEVTQCGPCYEVPDRAEADTTGDYCADTPATPEHIPCPDPTTSDPCTGADWGDVQQTNYMSYGIGCWAEFTSEQVARMHCWSSAELSTWWSCAADLDADGDIDRRDLALLLAAYGSNPGHPADLNGDLVVDVRDARLLLAARRVCP